MKAMIVIRGGCVESVYANGDIDIELVDFDNLDHREAKKAAREIAEFAKAEGVKELPLS